MKLNDNNLYKLAYSGALILAALLGAPQRAEAATGPLVMGASAPHRSKHAASTHSKPGSSRPAPAQKGQPTRTQPAPTRGSSPSHDPSQSHDSSSGRGPAPGRDASPGSNRPDPRGGQQGPRPVSFGQPGAPGAPGTLPGASRGNFAPSNFRGPGPAGQNERQGNQGGNAQNTARDHRNAGHQYAQNDPRGDAHRDHAHDEAWARTHRAESYRDRYEDSRRHYDWYQPRGWFRPWYPGAPHYWYTGVFVYGPPPGAPPPPAGHPRAELPPRKARHAGELSLGVRAGVFDSGYVNAPGYSDTGLGLAARYRFNDPLGVEVQWMYHDDTWQQGTSRIESPLSGSLELFAMPWARVNPYLLGGLSTTKRDFHDKTAGGLVEGTGFAWGPHVGVGLEFNLGKQTSLSFDARYLSFVNLPPDDSSRRGALQANAGLNFYF